MERNSYEDRVIRALSKDKEGFFKRPETIIKSATTGTNRIHLADRVNDTLIKIKKGDRHG